MPPFLPASMPLPHIMVPFTPVESVHNALPYHGPLIGGPKPPEVPTELGMLQDPHGGQMLGWGDRCGDNQHAIVPVREDAGDGQGL